MHRESIIWQNLPFNDMLKVITGNDERSFIAPEAYCFTYCDEIDGECTRHRHDFFANITTTLIFIIDVDLEGKITQSHFVYTNKTKRKKRKFRRIDGEDKWDRYCKSLLRVLYKEFLL